MTIVGALTALLAADVPLPPESRTLPVPQPQQFDSCTIFDLLELFEDSLSLITCWILQYHIPMIRYMKRTLHNTPSMHLFDVLYL
jgi:hypothetical protein